MENNNTYEVFFRSGNELEITVNIDLYKALEDGCIPQYLYCDECGYINMDNVERIVKKER